MTSQTAKIFSEVLLKHVEATAQTEKGKIFAHTTVARADGERIYDGLLYMDGKVYRLGFISDGGNLHGLVDEHSDKEQQSRDFEAKLKEAGLTLPEAEQARCTITRAAKQAEGPRFCKVPERDLQAIVKTLESGLCQEGLLLVKRLLAK